MNTLKAEKRTKDVKAKKLRREGYVTGNIFGREMKESVMIKMLKPEVSRMLKNSGKGGKATLNVEGEIYNVLIKDIDYDPMKNQINEIDFQALVSNEKIQSVANVIPVNHEMITEGVFQLLLPEIVYKALPDALVERIDLDVGHMRAGDSIKVEDLDIAKDKDVELVTSLDAIVAVVSEVRHKAEDGDTEEEEAED